MKIDFLFWRKKSLAQKIADFFGDVLRVFQVPFAGLPIVIWFFFIIAYILMPFNAVWLGDLPDSDDYTYLTQTLDWLLGQGWFDNVQHRMSPPEGVAIHYTRFAEMPIAAFIMLFRFLGYTWQGAGLLTSFVLPAVYLGLFFWVLCALSARYAPKGWACLAPFIALFGPHLMFKFAPGQVDHHGLLAILATVALILATQLFERRIVFAVGAGFIFALSMAIGLEALPWIVVASAVIGLWAALSGREAARVALDFGLSLFVFSAAFLALDRPSSAYLRPDLLSYSIVYVVLAGGIAASMLGAFVVRNVANAKIRLAVSGGVALLLGIAYLYYFPALLEGPYGAMDQRLASLFFANLEEALPMVERVGWFKALLYAVTPVIGFCVCFMSARAAKDGKRWSWILLGTLLGASVVLGFFYQIRLMIYAQVFSIVPLVVFAARGWERIGAALKGRPRFWAEIGLVLLLGPLTVVLLPALTDNRSFNTGVLMFPAQRVDNSCGIGRLTKVLTAPPYGDRKLRIMNMIGEGAGLLFYTPHEVMAAPYHTNVRGNMDALDFFSATEPMKAWEIAKRDQIDLVVLCHYVPTMYLNGDASSNRDEKFAVRLIQQEPPPWLKRVPVPKMPNFSLFEVKRRAP